MQSGAVTAVTLMSAVDRQPIPAGFLTCLLCAVLQAYDQHLNMILGEVEETVTTVEIDDETYEEIIKVSCSVLQERNRK
jgi:hypothetical protein